MKKFTTTLLLVAGCWLLVGSSVTLAASPRALSATTPGTKTMALIAPTLPGGFTLTLSTNLPVKIFTTSALGEKMVFLMGATNYTVQIPNDGGNRFFTTGAEVPLAWGPPTNNPAPVTGYNIYYGAAAGDYTIRRVPVGLTNATTMQVIGCPPELHITVTASFANGDESDFAWPEVVIPVPAVVRLTRNP